MYTFVCTGTPEHTSHSASKEQKDPSCPTCGAPTIEVRALDQHSLEVDEERGRIAEDHNLTLQQLFELAENLKDRGYSETNIAYILRLEVTDFRALMVQARNQKVRTQVDETGIKDQQFSDQIRQIGRNEELSDHEKRVAVGKALREAITRLEGEGKTVVEIADLTGLRESRVRELTMSYEVHKQSNIWFPGIYSGREGDYAKLVADVPEDRVVELIQQRAKEDGEWSIENNRVGGRPEFMRKMMEWVGDEANIRQCLKANPDETVDWICRDLANGSKWVGGSRD